MKHDVAAIEAHLLQELEELAQNQRTFDSSDESSEEGDFDNLEELLLQYDEVDGDDDEDMEPGAILATLAGFELFQSSSQLAITACGRALEEVKSARELLSEIDVDTTGTCTGSDEIDKDILLNEERAHAGVHLEENNVTDNVENRSGSLAGETDGYDDHVADNVAVEKSSGDLVDKTNVDDGGALSRSNDIVEEKVISYDEKKTLQEDSTPSSNQRNSYMAWMNNKPIEKQYAMDNLQEEIEREAEEEQLFKKRQRVEAQRKRAIKASKERVSYAHLSVTANRLQLTVRRFVVRRRAMRAENYRLGINKIVNTTNRYLKKQAVDIWVQENLFDREAGRITYWLRRCHERKRQRMMLHSEGMKRITRFMYYNRHRIGFEMWSMHVASERERTNLEMKRIGNAVVLQCATRAFLSRRQTHILREALRQHSVLLMQTVWRGFRARALYHFLQDKVKKQRTNAAVSIQKVFRSGRIRQRFKQARVFRYSYQDSELDDILDNEVDSMLNTMLAMDDSSNKDMPSHWQPKLPKLSTRYNEVEPTEIGSLPSYGMQGSVRDFNHEEKEASPRHEESKRGSSSQKHENLMDEWQIKDKRVLEVSLQSIDRLWIRLRYPIHFLLP